MISKDDGGMRAWAGRQLGMGPGRGAARIGDLPDVRIADLPISEAAKRELAALGNDVAAPGNPPSMIHDEATWERAKDAVRKNWDKYSEPYAVVMHVYENMGGAVG